MPTTTSGSDCDDMYRSAEYTISPPQQLLIDTGVPVESRPAYLA